SYRSDEAGDSPFLCDWRARQCDTNRLLHERQVQVGPLSEEQCLQLATTRLGIPIEALRTQLGKVHEGTHGNPYFVEQLLEGFDAQAGAFRIVPLDEIIDRKLARLPEGAKPLLEAIAIAGQAVTLAEAHAVCEQDMNAFSVATHMRS